MEMTRNDDVIRWLKWHARINLGVVMIFVVWVVIVFFASLHRGFGRAIVETLFGALLCLFMAWAILWLVDRTFGSIARRICVKKLQTQLDSFINPNFECTWDREPGVFRIDTRDGFLIVSSSQTGYFPIQLVGQDIMSTKIERALSIQTETKHSGSPFVRWKFRLSVWRTVHVSQQDERVSIP